MNANNISKLQNKKITQHEMCQKGQIKRLNRDNDPSAQRVPTLLTEGNLQNLEIYVSQESGNTQNTYTWRMGLH